MAACSSEVRLQSVNKHWKEEQENQEQEQEKEEQEQGQDELLSFNTTNLIGTHPQVWINYRLPI